MQELRCAWGVAWVARLGLVAAALVALFASAPGAARAAFLTEGRAAELARLPEVERVQSHLRAVEEHLRRREPAGLSAGQRRARLRCLDALTEYRERGVFPRNESFPGMRVPIFVDAYGTPCAMGYLIATSGWPGVTERVARTRNLAYVYQLAADPELGPVLGAWLSENGMTVDEAALVQPQYEPIPGPDSWYRRLSYATDWVNLGTIFVNRRKRAPAQSQRNGLVGVVVGGATLLLGTAYVADQYQQTRVVAAKNIFIGSITLTQGLIRYEQGRRGLRRLGGKEGNQGAGTSSAQKGTRGPVTVEGVLDIRRTRHAAFFAEEVETEDEAFTPTSLEPGGWRAGMNLVGGRLVLSRRF